MKRKRELGISLSSSRGFQKGFRETRKGWLDQRVKMVPESREIDYFCLDSWEGNFGTKAVKRSWFVIAADSIDG